MIPGKALSTFQGVITVMFADVVVHVAAVTPKRMGACA